jgi:DNA-binding NtrC family response regulator
MEQEIAIAHPNEKDGRRLGEILVRESYQIKVFKNLEKLQMYLQTNPCSTVIIDIDKLPVDQQLFRNLKRLLPDLSILTLSSRSFHPELEEAMSRHIFACLNKPVDPEELIFLLEGINNAA